MLVSLQYSDDPKLGGGAGDQEEGLRLMILDFPSDHLTGTEMPQAPPE